jgi:hypothetical protein
MYIFQWHVIRRKPYVFKEHDVSTHRFEEQAKQETRSRLQTKLPVYEWELGWNLASRCTHFLYETFSRIGPHFSSNSFAPKMVNQMNAETLETLRNATRKPKLQINK